MALSLIRKDWLMNMKTTMDKLNIFKYMVVAALAFCLFVSSRLYLSAADSDDWGKDTGGTKSYRYTINILKNEYDLQGVFDKSYNDSYSLTSQFPLKIMLFAWDNGQSTVLGNGTTYRLVVAPEDINIKDGIFLQKVLSNSTYTYEDFKINTAGSNGFPYYIMDLYNTPQQIGRTFYTYHFDIPCMRISGSDEFDEILKELAAGNDDVYEPEVSVDWDSALEDYMCGLNNFSATLFSRNLTVNWNGVTSSRVDLSGYKNIFVKTELVFSNGSEDFTYYIGNFKLNEGGFFTDISKYLDGDDLYLYSVECTPFYYNVDKIGNVVYYGRTSIQRFSREGSLLDPEHGGSGVTQPYPGSESTLDGYIYDSDCYFIDPTCNTFKNGGESIFNFVWSDVNCTNKDRRTNGIAVDIISGTNSYNFSFDEHFWGEKQLVVDYYDVSRLLRLAKVYHDDAIYGIRLIPYYTTLSGKYYGRSYVISFQNGEILDRLASTNDPIPDDPNESPEYEESVPPPLDIGSSGDILGSDFEYDDIWSYFISMSKSIFHSAGQFPALVNLVFGFMPSVYIQMIAFLLVVCIILRILGR